MAITYKCKNCGSTLQYLEGTTELHCDSCGSTFNVNEFDDVSSAQARERAMAGKTVQRSDFSSVHVIKENVKSFKCSSCGAELLTDENSSAVICSYCGSPSLIEERLSGVSLPGYLIPFKINKEQAVEEFRKWTKKGILTQSPFRDKAVIDKITGMYVPYWLFDIDARTTAHGECTTEHVWSDSEYHYTETKYYDVARDLSAEFAKVPADASAKLDDDMMDLLEPFSYGEMVEFKMPYLSGFVSEKFSFTADELYDRIRMRAEEFMADELKSTLYQYTGKMSMIPYTEVRAKNAKYVLLPVWLLSYRYNGENRLLAMNGQTGKQVGSLPVSKGKTAALFCGLFALFFVLSMVIGGMM